VYFDSVTLEGEMHEQVEGDNASAYWPWSGDARLRSQVRLWESDSRPERRYRLGVDGGNCD